VRYIDNSFFVAAIPKVNADEYFGRPVGWSFFGSAGGGYSDHFPVGARFETIEPGRSARSSAGYRIPARAGAPDRGNSPLNNIDYGSLPKSAVADANTLASLSDEELNGQFQNVFKIDGKLASATPPRIRLGARYFDLISFDSEVSPSLKSLEPGDRLRTFGELLEYRGKLEFMIQDASWWMD
jgi:hypothetical protein